MRDDLVALRMLVVGSVGIDRDTLRAAAAQAPLPLEVLEAETAPRAAAFLEDGRFDIVLLDDALPADDWRRVTCTARACRTPPFVVALADDLSHYAAGTLDADAVARKPAAAAGAQELMHACVQTRFPSRLLIVDDSPTMRTIVKKILSASRFPVDISETSDGRAALEMIARGAFDIVFLDYNMPGLNGVATLSELRRTAPCIKVVIMTSDGNPGVEERARENGANAFLRKPFYPADVDAVLYGLFGLQPLAKAG